MFKLCGDTDDVDDDDLSTFAKEYTPRVTPSDEQARKAELAALFEGAAGGAFAPTFEGGGVYFASSAEDPGAARDHWTNYNIAASLRPNYMKVDEYWAADLLLKRVRIFLAKRRAAKALVAGDLAIMEREIDKIQRAWRRHRGRAAFKARAVAAEAAAKKWRAFEDFRAALTSKNGEAVLLWDHEKKRTARAALRVDKSRHFLTTTVGRRTRKHRLKDVYRVTQGYASEFLRDLITQLAPEKHLSLWLRDAHGRRSSIDVAFDHGASVDVADDGKSRCDRFYRNFSRLLDELESEDAFFFDARGAYGRVGRSVFDRWEQVALLDPDWTGADGGARPADAGAAEGRGRPPARDRHLPGRLPPGCLLPAPLPPAAKPQHLPLKVVYEHVAPGGERRGAAWWSETVELSYGDFFAGRFDADGATRSKERFVLQRCVFDGDRWRRVDRPRRRDDAAAPRPEPMPTPELISYFSAQTRDLYGHVGVRGWRNAESGDFEFDGDNEARLVAFALGRGGKAAATAAKLHGAAASFAARKSLSQELTDAGGGGFAARLRRAFGRPRAADGAETDGGATGASSGDEAGPSGARQDAKHLRRLLLRQLYGAEHGKKGQADPRLAAGRMYEPGPVSFNSSQKMMVDARREAILRDAQAQRGEARAREARARRGEARADGPAAPGGARAARDDSEAGSDAESDGSPVKEVVEVASVRTLEQLREAPPTVSRMRGRRGESAKFRATLSCADGHRYEVTVSEKARRGVTPKLGLRCYAGEPVDFGRVRYAASLVVAGCSARAVPTVQLAYGSSTIRDGDRVVGVNGNFPAKPAQLAALLGDGRHKRRVTLVRPALETAAIEDDLEQRRGAGAAAVDV